MADHATAAPTPSFSRPSRVISSRQATTPARRRAEPMLIRISVRVLEDSSSVLRPTICDRLMGRFSSGCSLQAEPGFIPSVCSDIPLLLQKTIGQNILDAMDLHSEIRGRKTRDLSDGGRVQFLQVRNHDLPVQWLELAD